MPKPRYTRQELAEAVRTSTTMADVLRKVGLVPRGANYETAWSYIAEWGIDASHLRRRKPALADISDEEFRQAVAGSRSFAGALRKLGLTPTVSRYGALKRAIERFGLETSHMTGRASNRGRTFPQLQKPIEEFLVKGRFTNTAKLKRRLIERGVKERRCEVCLRTEWNGQPIPLELDHINGDRSDNRLENLRLVCPNCHAQTPTYRGRNIGRAS